MNQKGEVTLFSCLLLVTLMSIVLLSALELKKSFRLLERRTNLFLCIKESKGELNELMKFMGRTNWAIKNLNRTSIITIFIPGAQGAAMEAQKLKKYLQYIQDVRVVSYLKSLKDLSSNRCSLDPRMYITPFKLGTRLLERNNEGAAILREKEWNYGYFSKPYFITLKVKSGNWEKLKPKLEYTSEEKAAKLSSLLSSR